MTDFIHTDLIDNGLSELLGTGKSMCITQDQALTLSDVTNLHLSGGMRVTSNVALADGTITLVDGLNNTSRKLVIPSTAFNSAVLVAVSAVDAKLAIAIFDGTRLLFTSDSIANRVISVGTTINTAHLEFEIRQGV